MSLRKKRSRAISLGTLQHGIHLTSGKRNLTSSPLLYKYCDCFMGFRSLSRSLRPSQITTQITFHNSHISTSSHKSILHNPSTPKSSSPIIPSSCPLPQPFPQSSIYPPYGASHKHLQHHQPKPTNPQLSSTPFRAMGRRIPCVVQENPAPHAMIVVAQPSSCPARFVRDPGVVSGGRIGMFWGDGVTGFQ